MELFAKFAVVDDEAGMRDSLRYLLEREGFQVSTFERGSRLLEAMAQRRFDLFLLDIRLPEMDGFQLLDRIFRTASDAAVIMMTGQASVDSAVTAMKKGAYDYLRKPFEHEDLIKTVKNALHHHRLKEENRRIQKQLALSEKRYRHIVQNTPDIIYTLDSEGVFSFVNEAVERILGFHARELIGAPFSRIVYPEDLEKSRWLFEDRRSGERASAGTEIRLVCRQDPESYRHCLLSHLNVSSENSNASPAGKPVQVYGIARDISYRRLLEAQLREAQKMEAIGTLAGGVAHDFNNLLMCIQGYASLMLAGIDSTHAFHDKLLNIERNIELGAELTGQLLGFARRGKYQARPIDLNGLVKRTAEVFGRTKKEILIRYHLQENLWAALADEGQIEQVLLNLYVNAWQAMSGGGELALQSENVTVHGENVERIGLKPGDYVKVSVTDSGIGMDADIQERIFEPFFTTKERGRGTGLGLASAYGIVTNHGGTIRVFSKKGEGSTFEIYLPMTAEPLEETAENGRREIKTGTETILLVDDEDNIVQVTKEMLERMGYHVLVAKNGNEALEILKGPNSKIDLMILDMIMPGLSGGRTFDMARSVRADIKVLLSSGYSINGEAEEILQRGCDGFIQKPYSLNELSEKVSRILCAETFGSAV